MKVDEDGRAEMAFSNPPPCGCFEQAPGLMMERIDAAVHEIFRPAVEEAMKRANLCSVAAHYLLGAVIAYSVGVVMKKYIRDADRVDVPILNDAEKSALDGLIGLSVVNAHERIDQLNDYYKARALANN